MNTYYDLLGISTDASVGEIQQAYNNRIASLYQDFINNNIDINDYNRLYSACSEAKDVLANPDTRARYDERLGLGDDQNDYFRRQAESTGAAFTGDSRENDHSDNLDEGYVDDDEDFDEDFDDEEQHENTNDRKSRAIKIALITGACAVAVAAAVWVGPKIYRTITLKSDSPQSIVSVAQGDEKDKGKGSSSDNGAAVIPGETEDTSEYGSKDVTDGAETTTKPVETQPVVTVKNYGDIKDATLVNERATILLDELNNAKMTNITTGLPYTLEEIETLILYVNGEYVPASEEDASRLYTEFLNFICAPINIDDTLIQSAYLGGEESFKSTVEGFIANPKKPDIVTAFTYGDSYAAPYLYWLQDKYYEMRYTTDRDKATSIFNEVFQSYADVMKGDGFTLDGVTYTEKNILGLDKVGVSNLYIYFGLNAEVFRTTKTNDYFSVRNHLISANPDEQIDTVPYDEIGTWLNGACDISLIALDDEGRPLITSGEEGKTLGELTQINTIYRAKDNYLNENTKTLSK